VALLAKTLTHHALVTDEGRAVLDVVQRYSRTWRLLVQFDERNLTELPTEPLTPIAEITSLIVNLLEGEGETVARSVAEAAGRYVVAMAA